MIGQVHINLRNTHKENWISTLLFLFFLFFDLFFDLFFFFFIPEATYVRNLQYTF